MWLQWKYQMININCLTLKILHINCLTFLGILGSIFDGIQRPLKVSIETKTKEVWQIQHVLKIRLIAVFMIIILLYRILMN